MKMYQDIFCGSWRHTKFNQNILVFFSDVIIETIYYLKIGACLIFTDSVSEMMSPICPPAPVLFEYPLKSVPDMDHRD